MTARATDLADPEFLAATVRSNHRRLGLDRAPARVDLLDVRIKHPHRPDSQRCRGWATVRVAAGDGIDAPVFLLRSEEAAPPPLTGMPLPGASLRAWRFPDDPALPALALLTDPAAARALLPRDLAAWHVVEQVQVVKWQPGESATVHCRLARADGDRTTVPAAVYAKVLAREGVAAVDAAQRRWYAQPPPGLRVAEPLAADPAHRVLWTRAVLGRPVLAVRRDDGRPALPLDAARQAGRWLAALHGSGPALSDRVVEPVAVAAEAAKKARKIADARPRYGEAVRRLAAIAAALPAAGPARRRCLHGDFHVDQMLLTDGGLVVLDLDEVVTGDPALDLAELAVDLGLRGLPRATTDRFLRCVAASYEGAGGRLPAAEVLLGYAAAELLNRCYRHLRRPVGGWERALGGDLGAGAEVLAGALATARRTDEEARA
jgi:hypothetical protein